MTKVDQRTDGRGRVALIGVALFAAVRAVADATGESAWLGWLASWLGLMAMLPIPRRAARALRPPLLPWAATPLAHLPVALLFSAGHSAIALAIRKLASPTVLGESAAALFRHQLRLDLPFYALTVAWLLLAVRRP